DTLYGTVVSVRENRGLPTELNLYQNYPNPFNPSTTIEFDISTSGPARLLITNLLGQEVAQLVNEPVSVGRHQATFNASNLASGVYIYSLSTPNGVLHRRLLLLK
ncbi:MAG: T9SS type A sorting domain-containing protein, partial [Bacteroidota bacterium]